MICLEDMLRKIMSVDKKAKESVDKVKKERENIEKRLLETKKEYEEKYEKTAENKIAALKAKKQEEYGAETQKYDAEFSEKARLLEEKFALNKEKWVSELTKRVLS